MTQTLNITAICSQLPKQIEDVSRRERRAHFAVLDRLRTSFSDVPAAEIKRQVARAIAQGRAESESSNTLALLLPHEGGGDA
jgi:hypothetical protein